MSEKEFLQWIYDRLVNVHNENELYDYMHKFKEIINTRAVPDVPELVRYHIWFDNNYNEIVDEDPEGEYVRYDQAAKVIAKLTKDANHQCRERVKEFERAEAAEAELALIKALLKDHNAVHIALLRGDIAKPTAKQINHVYAALSMKESK